MMLIKSASQKLISNVTNVVILLFNMDIVRIELKNVILYVNKNIAFDTIGKVKYEKKEYVVFEQSLTFFGMINTANNICSQRQN